MSTRHDFDPYKMKPDAWLRDYRDHYEHVAVRADDLLISLKYLRGLIDIPTKNISLNSKARVPYHII